MTGPEHYAEAERLVTQSKSRSEYDSEFMRMDLAEAQVHATLALVAATVADRYTTAPEVHAGSATYVMEDGVGTTWSEVTS